MTSNFTHLIGKLGSIVLAIVLSMLFLVACGNSNDFPAPNTTGAEGMRTVTDIDGNEVEVPENPKRLVTLSEPTLDASLALGITPIGSVAGRGQQGIPGYLAEEGEGILILGTVSELNFEAIGAAAPDLILVDGTSVNNNPPILEALREIAPVVYTGYAGGEWRINFRNVANALNLVDEGEKLIRDYEKRTQKVAKELAPKYSESTFSIVRWQGNSAALILTELPAGQVLTDLGMKRPPNQDRRGRGHSEPVSAENIAEIDADFMFFGTLGGSSVGNPDAGGGTDLQAAAQAIAQAEQIPGFTSLVAYQTNNVIPVDGSLWTSTGGPMLLNKIIDNIESIFL